MAAKRLEEIKVRLEGISQPPWQMGEPIDVVLSSEPKNLAEDIRAWEYYGGMVVGESMRPQDRDFIIHAPTDMQALFDYINFLHKDMNKMHTKLKEYEDAGK